MTIKIFGCLRALHFTDDTGIRRNTELEAAPDLAEASLICVLT